MGTSSSPKCSSSNSNNSSSHNPSSSSSHSPKCSSSNSNKSRNSRLSHTLRCSSQAAPGPHPGGIQIVQPIITPTGVIHQIPIQLNAQQLQVIRAQMMVGAGSSQPIVIHTAPIQAPTAQPAQTVQTIQLQGGQHVYNIQQQY